MALEPIFEVEFHDSSYGFRPNRSTHHAAYRCQQMARSGFTWGIEGDVKACFAERLMDEIRDFLRETCGLELSAEKTRITHLRDGYDFRGFNISLGVGRTGAPVPKIKVGRKAIANIQARLSEALRYRPTQESISVRLVRSSAVIRRPILILQRYTHDVTHDVATTYINSTLIARLAVSSFAVTTYGEHVAL